MKVLEWTFSLMLYLLLDLFTIILFPNENLYRDKPSPSFRVTAHSALTSPVQRRSELLLKTKQRSQWIGKIMVLLHLRCIELHPIDPDNKSKAFRISWVSNQRLCCFLNLRCVELHVILTIKTRRLAMVSFKPYARCGRTGASSARTVTFSQKWNAAWNHTHSSQLRRIA